MTMPCPISIPVVYTIGNSASAHQHACQVIARELAKLGPAAAPNLSLAVTLLVGSKLPARCALKIEVVRGSNRVAVASGGAKAAGTDLAVAQHDCIEAVLTDMVQKQIVPVLRRAGSGAGTGSSVGSTTTPGPTSP